MKAVIPFLSQLSAEEQTAWLDALGDALPDYDVARLEHLSLDQRAAAEVAIVANPDPADLADLPNLKWVQSLWAGVESLLAETQGTPIAIVRMTDPQLASTMAEAVLAWTLYLHRDMPRYRQQQAARTWQPHPVPRAADRTVGVLGLGNLGELAARTLAQHGFTVCGWSRSVKTLAGITTFRDRDGLTQMLQHCTILVCLLPLTAETEGLLNAGTLALLPQGASVINFARGPIIDTEALLDSLDKGQLSHAVLDVFDEEPLPPHSPLWTNPSITVLPHISAPTNKQTAVRIVADNLSQFFASRQIPSSVNRQLGY